MPMTCLPAIGQTQTGNSRRWRLRIALSKFFWHFNIVIKKGRALKIPNSLVEEGQNSKFARLLFFEILFSIDCRGGKYPDNTYTKKFVIFISHIIFFFEIVPRSGALCWGFHINRACLSVYVYCNQLMIPQVLQKCI